MPWHSWDTPKLVARRVNKSSVISVIPKYSLRQFNQSCQIHEIASEWEWNKHTTDSKVHVHVTYLYDGKMWDMMQGLYSSEEMKEWKILHAFISAVS